MFSLVGFFCTAWEFGRLIFCFSCWVYCIIESLQHKLKARLIINNARVHGQAITVSYHSCVAGYTIGEDVLQLSRLEANDTKQAKNGGGTLYWIISCMWPSIVSYEFIDFDYVSSIYSYNYTVEPLLKSTRHACAPIDSLESEWVHNRCMCYPHL